MNFINAEQARKLNEKARAQEATNRQILLNEAERRASIILEEIELRIKLAAITNCNKTSAEVSYNDKLGKTMLTIIITKLKESGFKVSNHVFDPPKGDSVWKHPGFLYVDVEW